MKPFMFATDNRSGRGYKPVVYAMSKQKAVAYAKQSHKELKFIQAGEPPSKDGWTAAIVKE